MNAGNPAAASSFSVVIGSGTTAQLYRRPRAVLRGNDVASALAALAQVDRALADGFHVAGYVAYELGAHFAGLPQAASTGSLVALGVFEAPEPFAPHAYEGASIAPPRPRIDRTIYDHEVARIARAIYDGEVYQVNYTVPFDVAWSGDVLSLYTRIAARAQAPYCACVLDGDRAVLSWSPELFLAFDGERIETRPMKGSASLECSDDLQNEKNRAEHVMIVDLLRNDFSKVCDEVDVTALLTVERYPTFATMTSTVRGRLRGNAGFADVIAATFPCGSVTGAPKRAAMAAITRAESHPRGVYCGSVGFLTPQRRGWWNVAIRTMQLDRRNACARFDAGGGIVADSLADDEWHEVVLKSRFLDAAIEPFSFWETFANRDASTMERHLERLAATARTFSIPFSMQAARAALGSTQADGIAPALLRLRLGLDGTLRTASEPLAPTPEPVDVCIADARLNSGDPMLAFKSSWRPAHASAALQASATACFDAILLNERGEVVEGARTNVFARIGGRLVTPPLRAGALPGILRSRIVTEQGADEIPMTRDDLRRAEEIFVGNSARGLLRARLREECCEVVDPTLIYPYVIEPKLTTAIWGGHALVRRFGKAGDPDATIGESWECWDTNLIANGPLAGSSIAQLRERLGAALLGTIDATQAFPVLTKFIDARDWLSVQVHPDDAYAQRVEHQANGKTECWYVLHADAGAELVLGWTRDTDRAEYERRVADGTLGEILRRVPVKAGDAFYLPAGTLHAIGKGIIVYETQQASDLTYRIFDWNRAGADGTPRELHVKKASDVLDYHAGKRGAVEPIAYHFGNLDRTMLIADPRFIVERINATQEDASMFLHERPAIISALERPLTLHCNGNTVTLAPYNTALVPAACEWARVRAGNAPAPFLLVTLPRTVDDAAIRLLAAGVDQARIDRFLTQFQP